MCVGSNRREQCVSPGVWHHPQGNTEARKQYGIGLVAEMHGGSAGRRER